MGGGTKEAAASEPAGHDIELLTVGCVQILTEFGQLAPNAVHAAFPLCHRRGFLLHDLSMQRENGGLRLAGAGENKNK